MARLVAGLALILAMALPLSAGAAVQPGTGQWFASQVIGLDAHGDGGMEFGTVEDLVLDEQGVVRQVVIAAGGVLGVGGTRLLVPWEETEVALGHEAVRVPVNESNYAGFQFDDIEGVLLDDSGLWRVRDLAGGEVLLGRESFGEVIDVAFNEESMLVAVVAQSAQTGAAYAMPRTQIRIGPRMDAIDYVAVQSPDGVPEEWRLDLTPQPLDMPPMAAVPDKEASPQREAEEARLAELVRQWEQRVENYRAVHGRTTGAAGELLSEFQSLQMQWRKLRQTEGSSWDVQRRMFDDALARLRQKWQQVAEAAE